MKFNLQNVSLTFIVVVLKISLFIGIMILFTISHLKAEEAKPKKMKRCYSIVEVQEDIKRFESEKPAKIHKSSQMLAIVKKITKLETHFLILKEKIGSSGGGYTELYFFNNEKCLIEAKIVNTEQITQLYLKYLNNTINHRKPF